MKMLISALVLVTSSIVAGQRGSFAGTRPIGFPDTPNRTTTTPDPLGNRFGEGVPQRLPVEANGDWDLVDRLSKLPIDKQPFWFINWQSYEKHRQDPQTYPQRPNSFVDPIPLNSNSGQVNNGFSTPTSGFIGTQPTVIVNRFGPTTVPSQPSNNGSPSGNFNNNPYPIYNINPNVNSNVNPISNVNPNGNPISNVNPTGNPISNVYTTANPTGNANSNVNPIGNPTDNPNSNLYQTSNLNSHSNYQAVTKNGAIYQTTQKQWESYFMASNLGTILKRYPVYYPQTDIIPSF